MYSRSRSSQPAAATAGVLNGGGSRAASSVVAPSRARTVPAPVGGGGRAPRWRMHTHTAPAAATVRGPDEFHLRATGAGRSSEARSGTMLEQSHLRTMMSSDI
eukprot:scaffold8069_cov126-Isochrysis_galbana.AAC.10